MDDDTAVPFWSSGFFHTFLSFFTSALYVSRKSLRTSSWIHSSTVCSMAASSGWFSEYLRTLSTKIIYSRMVRLFSQISPSWNSCHWHKRDNAKAYFHFYWTAAHKGTIFHNPSHSWHCKTPEVSLCCWKSYGIHGLCSVCSLLIRLFFVLLLVRSFCIFQKLHFYSVVPVALEISKAANAAEIQKRQSAVKE